MKRKLAVDRSIYLVDEDNRTYRFLKRNPDWESVSREESKRNKAARRLHPDLPQPNI